MQRIPTLGSIDSGRTCGGPSSQEQLPPSRRGLREGKAPCWPYDLLVLWAPSFAHKASKTRPGDMGS